MSRPLQVVSFCQKGNDFCMGSPTCCGRKCDFGFGEKWYPLLVLLICIGKKSTGERREEAQP